MYFKKVFETAEKTMDIGRKLDSYGGKALKYFDKKAKEAGEQELKKLVNEVDEIYSKSTIKQCKIIHKVFSEAIKGIGNDMEDGEACYVGSCFTKLYVDLLKEKYKGLLCD